MTDPQTMDEANIITEKILNFTLEIIYLITGEDYIVVKKTSVEHVTTKNMLSPHVLRSDKNNNKKILDVTCKITELLTGEDVTVCFSSEEEVEELEENKDLYKDIKTKNRPPATSPDGSSNENPPERCPQDNQVENLITIKVEVKEEAGEPSVRDDDLRKEGD
ncbi:unnamed protein product, partial [Staurois parvus]